MAGEENRIEGTRVFGRMPTTACRMCALPGTAPLPNHPSFARERNTEGDSPV
jgi:hypothetical protein